MTTTTTNGTKVFWRGKQWRVTRYGLETLDGSYAIARDRLADYRPGRDGISDWLCHMVEKDWVDVEDFSTAFVIALAVHDKDDRFRLQDLQNTIAWMHSYREYEEKFTAALKDRGNPFRVYCRDDLEAAGGAVGDAPEPPRSVGES